MKRTTYSHRRWRWMEYEYEYQHKYEIQCTCTNSKSISWILKITWANKIRYECLRLQMSCIIFWMRHFCTVSNIFCWISHELHNTYKISQLNLVTNNKYAAMMSATFWRWNRDFKFRWSSHTVFAEFQLKCALDLLFSHRRYRQQSPIWFRYHFHGMQNAHTFAHTILAMDYCRFTNRCSTF